MIGAGPTTLRLREFEINSNGFVVGDQFSREQDLT